MQKKFLDITLSERPVKTYIKFLRTLGKFKANFAYIQSEPNLSDHYTNDFIIPSFLAFP